MGEYTSNLNLYKTDMQTDGDDEFDFERDLNENLDKIDAVTGLLSALETTEKTNLVGAINEVLTELNSLNFPTLDTSIMPIMSNIYLGSALSGGDYSGQPKENAFDGYTTNWWYSSQMGTSVSGNAYIGKNFDSPKNIDSILLIQGTGINAITSVKVQTATNGSNWTDAQTFNSLVDGANLLTLNTPIPSNSYTRLLANSNLGAGNAWVVQEIIFNPNSIDFSVGFCWDDTLTKKIVSTAMRKSLGANFVAGTKQGGLDTGSKAINTNYACFAICKEDGTSDFLFSANLNPTLPSGFIYKRRIGWIRTDGNGNVQYFKQNGDYMSKMSVSELNLTNTPTVAPTNLTTSIPPDCIAMLRTILIGASTSSDDTTVGLGDLSIPGNNALTVGTKGVASGREYNNCLILVNSNSQILYCVTCAGGNAQQVLITSFGYIDKRGKN